MPVRFRPSVPKNKGLSVTLNPFFFVYLTCCTTTGPHQPSQPDFSARKDLEISPAA